MSVSGSRGAMGGYRAAGYDDYFAHGAGAYWGPLAVKGQSRPSWLNTPPCGHLGRLATQSQDTAGQHEITEHGDGSITVSPSILCRECGWHGWLEDGEWRLA